MAGTSWPALVAGHKAKASEVEAKFDWLEGSLVPMTGGNQTTGVYDLGTTTARWRNIHFSGQMFAALGTGAAPGIATYDDSATGIWFSTGGWGAVGISINGRRAFKVHEPGVAGNPSQVSIGDTSPANMMALNGLKYSTSGIGFDVNGVNIWASGTMAVQFDKTTIYSPLGDAAMNLGGGAVNYWNNIDYKTLTDRGCLAWMDEGVELAGGTIATDLQAIQKIRKHPTKKTIYGLPMLDYKSFPKVSYKRASKARLVAGTAGKVARDAQGRVLEDEFPRDANDEPIPFTDERGVAHVPADGIEMTSVFSLMLGAIKELTARVEALEAKGK